MRPDGGAPTPAIFPDELRPRFQKTLRFLTEGTLSGDTFSEEPTNPIMNKDELSYSSKYKIRSTYFIQVQCCKKAN